MYCVFCVFSSNLCYGISPGAIIYYYEGVVDRNPTEIIQLRKRHFESEKKKEGKKLRRDRREADRKERKRTRERERPPLTCTRDCRLVPKLVIHRRIAGKKKGGREAFLFFPPSLRWDSLFLPFFFLGPSLTSLSPKPVYERAS